MIVILVKELILLQIKSYKNHIKRTHKEQAEIAKQIDIYGRMVKSGNHKIEELVRKYLSQGYLTAYDARELSFTRYQLSVMSYRLDKIHHKFLKTRAESEKKHLIVINNFQAINDFELRLDNIIKKSENPTIRLTEMHIESNVIDVIDRILKGEKNERSNKKKSLSDTK